MQQPDQPNPQAQTTSYANQPKASYPDHPQYSQSQDPDPNQVSNTPPQQGYPAPYPPQGYPAPYPPQQMYPPPPMMQQTLNVNVQHGSQHGFITRALYFIFIGWWFGFFWLNLGFALCATVILLPLGLMMLNRLPQVLTLQAPKPLRT